MSKFYFIMSLCSICKDKPDVSYKTQCNHIFCYKCIFKYIYTHNNCPNCKHSPVYAVNLTPLSNYKNTIYKFIKPFPFKNYKDGDLKKLCKEYRIKFEKNKKFLLERIENYILLNNTEAQKEIPIGSGYIRRQLYLLERKNINSSNETIKENLRKLYRENKLSKKFFN